MLKIKDEGIILEKTNLEFENKAVLNPACLQVDNLNQLITLFKNQQKESQNK
jgi:hypothetical protein